MSLAEAAIFEYAFKLGSRIIYEALCEHIITPAIIELFEYFFLLFIEGFL